MYFTAEALVLFRMTEMYPYAKITEMKCTFWKDACPTDDQEVVGSSQPGQQHVVKEIDHEIFSADSRKAVVSFWQKMCTIMLTAKIED